MIQISAPEYGVTEYESTVYKIRITATLEQYIEVDADDDIEEAVDEAISEIELGNFDFDYDIIGEETERIYVKG